VTQSRKRKMRGQAHSVATGASSFAEAVAEDGGTGKATARAGANQQVLAAVDSETLPEPKRSPCVKRLPHWKQSKGGGHARGQIFRVNGSCLPKM
jgi:hypothetical protein